MTKEMYRAPTLVIKETYRAPTLVEVGEFGELTSGGLVPFQSESGIFAAWYIKRDFNR